MLTIVAYHPTGYEVRIDVDSEKLDATIRWLDKHNYLPVRDMNAERELGVGRPKPEPTTLASAQVQQSSAGNGREAKVNNSPGTAEVATINDDLFGD